MCNLFFADGYGPTPNPTFGVGVFPGRLRFPYKLHSRVRTRCTHLRKTDSTWENPDPKRRISRKTTVKYPRHWRGLSRKRRLVGTPSWVEPISCLPVLGTDEDGAVALPCGRRRLDLVEQRRVWWVAGRRERQGAVVRIEVKVLPCPRPELG